MQPVVADETILAEEEKRDCDPQAEASALTSGGGTISKRKRQETLSEVFTQQWFAVPANQKAVDETIQMLIAGQMCLWPEEDEGRDKTTSPMTPSVKLTLNSKQCNKQQLMVALDTFAQSDDCEAEIWYLVLPNSMYHQHHQRILQTQQQEEELVRKRQQQPHLGWTRASLGLGAHVPVGSFDPFTGERLVAPDYDATGNPLKMSAIKEPEFGYYIELIIPASIYLAPPADYPPRVVKPYDHNGGGGQFPMERYEIGSFGVSVPLRPATRHPLPTGGASKRQCCTLTVSAAI